MTLSKKQKAESDPQKYFYLWERDLLQMAKEHQAWRDKAHELGFTDTKIDAPWPHADAGRKIAYMVDPWWAEKHTKFEYDDDSKTLTVQRI